LVTVDGASRLINPEFGGGPDESRSWMQCIAQGLLDMATQSQIASCMTGSYFDVEDMLEGTYSPLKGRTIAYYDSPRISKEHVWGLLRKHMPRLPEAIPASMVEGLERLEGRPYFLFDKLLAPVFSGPFTDNDDWPDDVKSIQDVSARRLAGRVSDRLDTAWEEALSNMLKLIEWFITPRNMIGGATPSCEAENQLLARILQGHFLFGEPLNSIDVSTVADYEAVMKKAVRVDLFVWAPDRPKEIMQEGVVNEALQKYGRYRVMAGPADKDLVLQDLADRVGPQFSKGSNFEVAIAWGLMRACIRGPVPLTTLLAEIVAPGLKLPDSIASKEVHVTGAAVTPKFVIDEGDPSKPNMDDWQKMEGTSTIWHGFTPSAGMDLMLRTTDNTLIGIQAKSEQTKLPDAVASCTLGWQYMQGRNDVAKGTPPTSSNKQKWFRDHLPEGARENHVRLVFSVSGFTETAVKIINEHNERFPESSIILCQSSKAMFGPCHDKLKEVCGEVGAVSTSGKAPAAMLLCQPIEDGKPLNNIKEPWSAVKRAMGVVEECYY